MSAVSQFIPESWEDKAFYRPPIRLDCTMTRALLADRVFSESPLVIGDVGAGWVSDRSWEVFADQCLWVGFEPNMEGTERIKAEFGERDPMSLLRRRVENIGLWDRSGKTTLYVTKEPTCSSCFLPNMAFFERLPDQSQVQVVDTLEIPVTTLDDYHRQNGLDFDVLNLDVQGAELAVLKGGLKQLHDSILAVVAEVEFNELYRGQPLFADIDQFMRAHGFMLFDLDIRRWRRTTLPKAFVGLRVGQIIYADALYLRDPVNHDTLPADGSTKRLKLLKLATLAEFFSLPDYAIEILLFARDQDLVSDAEKNRLVDLLHTNSVIGKYSRFEAGWVDRSSKSS